LIEQYRKLVKLHTEELSALTKKYKALSLARLLSLLVSLYLFYNYIKFNSTIFVIFAVLFFILFLVLIKVHDKMKFKRDIKQQLVDINKDEIGFLSTNLKPFDAGEQYVDYSHNYSHDLDIFGEESLYHHLNRCYTFVGQESLAHYFKNNLKHAEILDQQKAIQELSRELSWRQDFTALARHVEDKKTYHDFILKWINHEQVKPLSKVSNFLSYLMPLVFLAYLICLFIWPSTLMLNIGGIILAFNLLILGSQLKKIKDSLLGADKLHKILHQNALIIDHIESKEFNADLLQNFKSGLTKDQVSATDQFKKLSSLFSEMSSLDNLMASVIMNGSALYHLHKYRALNKWKTQYAQHLATWLEVIGKVEAISSLANFAYNNPAYTYPEINKESKINFSDLGHPLIDQETRICNDISFIDQKFVVLTGSNMSGKSTFLRSLGINLVLTGVGAPVCASSASVNPLPLLVSMRAQDSLSDNESYFFAEVKRLKKLISQCDQNKSFVPRTLMTKEMAQLSSLKN